MKIIEGFESAKSALSRQGPALEPGDNEPVVRQIIDEVRRRGDAALIEYTEKFDGVKLVSLEVPGERVAQARNQVAAGLVSALKIAAERIRAFHAGQRDAVLGGLGKLDSVRARPLARVGLYAPGGTAGYPSTVLMTAIPARVAGVGEIILVTPPDASGTVPPLTLAAADIAGVDRVFAIGGAQAIAALAYGTESVPAVDKICGPGNIFVVRAKKLVYGVVGIDGLQGPSEVVIIADDTAGIDYVAADLLAQAEHDPLAAAILITTSKRLADGVNREIDRQMADLSRRAIAGQSLESRGLIAVVSTIGEAIELANLYAPEHLCLMVGKAESYLDRVCNAGCVFLGQRSSVVLGDYVAGPSHVLPTGGTARFSSPLNVLDFIKLTNVVNIEEIGLKELGEAARTIAAAEGLEAHARAVDKRLNQGNGE